MAFIKFVQAKTIFCLLLLYSLACASDRMPKGHLLPLGHQRPPSVLIDEFNVETAPTPELFYEEYIKPSKAAIFRGAMKTTTAYKSWTDEYIKQYYGDLEVRLEGKKEKVHATPVGEKYMGRDTLRHFIETYHSPDSLTYVVSELPKQMYDDVGVLPSLGACGEMGKTFVEIDLWWSGGGSKSVIHKDAFNQINCLYRGTKYWKLYEYKYEKWLYKHWEPEDEIGGFSDINVEAVDLEMHPDFMKVPWSNFTIQAGDCLFLPKSYYHQVDSDGPVNLAVSILFSRLDEKNSIDTSDCTVDTNYRIPRKMSEFKIMWQWEGKGNMTMGYGDLEENYRSPLLHMAKEAEKLGIDVTADRLEDIFGVGQDGDGDEIKFPAGNLTKAVTIIDSNEDGKLSSLEIQAATFEQLKDFGREIEAYEPSNTYEYEYSFISYWSVLQTLKNAMEKNKVLTRKNWTKIYKFHCQGTERLANEVFTGLVDSEEKNSLRSEDIGDGEISRALKNWIRYWAPQYSAINEHPGRKTEFKENVDDPEEEEQVHEEL